MSNCVPGTGTNYEKCVNATQNSIQKFQPGIRATFLDFPLFLGIFQWEEPTKCVPFTAEPEIPEILTKWKAPVVSTVAQANYHFFGSLLSSKLKSTTLPIVIPVLLLITDTAAWIRMMRILFMIKVRALKVEH